MARTPVLRMLENSLSFVRLTIPFLVKKTMDFSSLKSVVGRMERMRSSCTRLTRLTTALPLAVLV